MIARKLKSFMKVHYKRGTQVRCFLTFKAVHDMQALTNEIRSIILLLHVDKKIFYLKISRTHGKTSEIHIVQGMGIANK